MDVEAEWTGIETSYHLIFSRMLHGAIQDWEGLFLEVFAHLSPGGGFELVEIDLTPRCDEAPR